MRITPLGDRALLIELGTEADVPTHERVQATFRLLESPLLPGVTEVVPAFATVTLFYDPLQIAEPGESAESAIDRLSVAVRVRLRGLGAKTKGETRPIVEIPVCYGGPFGPDLEQVAGQTGLSPEEVVRRHSSIVYLVFLIGFSPGFPYLGTLPESLALPRRPVARTAVAPGSVGIANQQCCIYPMATPGGWNLIGRTPLALFRLDANPPSLLRPGDRVKFRAITPDEFGRRKGER